MRSRGSDTRYRTSAIVEAISTGEGGGVMHGPTFMGNPLSCAVAVAAVELLPSRDWRAEVSSLTTGLADGLMPARDLGSVADVRVLGGVGVIGVIELHSPADMPTATVTAVDAGCGWGHSGG
jgi:adenosylmethionine-8-amino-7-oxononanoate aminotransferase